MVPTVYAVLSSVPLLQSGKLDRKTVLSYLTIVTESTIATLANSMLRANSIPEDDSLAMSLSERVASLLSKHVDSSLYSVILGWDVGLVAAGIDSISAISPRKFVLETHQTNISVKTILNEDTTITSLAKLIRVRISGEVLKKDSDSGFDIRTEAKNCLGNWLESVMPHSPEFHARKPDGHKTVFLTGGTGYLGSHILLALLNRSEITRVILHVRADNEGHAKERLITAAMTAGWWKDEYKPRIEVWVGDLSKPLLGLDEQLWSKLKGGHVDIIIHNGCEVNWHKDYDSLKATNVMSTLALLQAVEQAVMPINFVYVSARMEDIALDETEQLSNETIGYIQTKLVSEQLIQKYLKRDTARKRDFAVARPDLIMGTPSNGVANIDDFIWRLAAGTLETQCLPIVDLDNWLFVSDVGSVAETISLAGIYRNSTDNYCLRFDDGLPVKDFWDIIASTADTDIHAVEINEWIAKLAEHAEMEGGEHPPWAVQSFLPNAAQHFQNKPPPKYEENRFIHDAVKMNVHYLMEIGVLRGKYTYLEGKWLGQ